MGNSPASRSGTRKPANRAAAGAVRLSSSDPGRAITAIGIVRAMLRQSFQRWNWARLSAPITHTNRRRGQIRRSARSVSMV